MRKIVIIDENDSKRKMHRLINNSLFEWFLYMIGYSIVLIGVSYLFKKSFYVALKYYGMYAFFASVIIYILNQTVKPILFYLTLPITALTFGLFYPIINVLILYLTSFILGSHFEIHGFFISIVIAVVISVLNLFMEGMIIKPIIRKGK